MEFFSAVEYSLNGCEFAVRDRMKKIAQNKNQKTKGKVKKSKIFQPPKHLPTEFVSKFNHICHEWEKKTGQ